MDDAANLQTITPGRILIVDDDDQMLASFARTLKRAGHTVTAVSSGAEALRVIEHEPFDLMVSDLHMPEMDGLELVQRLRARDEDLAVVFLTGAPGLESAVSAIRFGAVDYIAKPIAVPELNRAIFRALRATRISRLRRTALDSPKSVVPVVKPDAELNRQFEHALEKLWMAFQPIVTRTGEPYGFESLMRNRAPGYENPMAMLAAAEALHRIHDLEVRIHSQTAAEVVDRPDIGYLFLNVHPQALFDDELLGPGSRIAPIAGRIVLEITEREALSGRADVKTRVEYLRRLGFRIAIDDLGAGYAGLTAFALIEPDVVKLDMGLVRGIHANRTKQKIVSSLTALSHDLGISVVAEGVETIEELDALCAMGCDLFQGYLIGRPGPAFPVAKWPTERSSPLEATHVAV